MKILTFISLINLASFQLLAQSKIPIFNKESSRKETFTNQKALQKGVLNSFTPYFEIPTRPDSADYYFNQFSAAPVYLGRFKISYVGSSNRVQQLDLYFPNTQILGARIVYTYNAQLRPTSLTTFEAASLGGPLNPVERQILTYDSQNNLVAFKQDSASNGNWFTYSGDSLTISYTGTAPTTLTYSLFDETTNSWESMYRMANVSYNAAGEVTGFTEQYPSFLSGVFETFGRFTGIQWNQGWPGLFSFATGTFVGDSDFGAILVNRKQEPFGEPTAFLFETTFDGSTFENSDRRQSTVVGGVVTQIIDQTWDGIAWENDFRTTFQYANGNVIQQVEGYWDGTTYITDYQSDFFFDASNNYRGFRGYIFNGSQPTLSYRDTSIINYVGGQIKSFSYQLEFNGQVTAIDSIIYNPTGLVNVKNNKLLIDLNTFPNPTKGQVSLFLGADVEPGNYQISLFDLSGKMVYQESLFLNANQTESLDFSNFNTGIYLLKVEGAQGFYHQKLIIQE